MTTTILVRALDLSIDELRRLLALYVCNARYGDEWSRKMVREIKEDIEALKELRDEYKQEMPR